MFFIFDVSVLSFLNRFVTGGSRGIGYGVCQSLAKEGYNIVIGDIRDEKETELAVQELSKMDCEVLYIQTDVSNLKARKKLLREIDEHFGCLQANSNEKVDLLLCI